MSLSHESFEPIPSAQPATPGSEDDLAEYRHRQLELADLIRGAMNLAAERGDERRRRDARELLARLAADRFTLAVVGQFSRGKSTLMNAILGHPYLPVGALPMTSVVTRVAYGSRPRVTVRRRGGSGVPIETSLEDLARFVAQSSMQREERQVVSADVEVPVEVLRLGFSFVDTPGIGSAVAANTATTKHFLPEADAVIFVTAFDAPLSEAELEFLAEVRHHVNRVFFVVNKLDLVSRTEAIDVIRFVRERLAQHSNASAPAVFPVSSRDALDAKRQADPVGLAESRLPELEQALVQFLTSEKAPSFLLGLCARAERLLAQLRLDLELGRVGRSPVAAANGRAGTAFEHRVAELLAHERRLAEGLAERIEAELPRLLVERSDVWTDEVRRLALGELDAEWPPGNAHASAGWVQEAASQLSQRARALFDRWLAERRAEARALLVTLSAGELDELHSLQEAIEQVAAETFGVTYGDAIVESTWSPADLPELVTNEVPLLVRVELPRSWRIVSRSRTESEERSRLIQAVDAALTDYTDRVRAALVRAGREWVANVAAAVERETRSRADRLLENTGNPAGEEQFAALERLGRDLAAFRVRTIEWRPAPPVPPDAEPAPSARLLPQRSTRCTICAQVAKVPVDYMAHAQWELARRDGARSEHVRAGGFCPLHTWEYEEMASTVGIALAYAPLAEAAGRLIDSADSGKWLEEALARFMPDPGRCPACVALADAERAAVEEFLAGLPVAPGGAAAPLLCIRHLAAVAATDPESQRVRWLAESLAQTLSRTSEDLRTYALKRESLRGDLLSDEEDAAVIQVISYLAGARPLARPWRRRDEIG
jgi:GTPase SAR1 family protein